MTKKYIISQRIFWSNITKTFILIFLLLLINPQILFAQNKLIINDIIWSSLTQDEKIYASKFFENIDVIPGESIGIVSSVQVVNRSTSASHHGAFLGSVAAQAAYIDKGGSYSAINHLGVALIGAAVGGSLDRGENLKYIHNYAIKNLNNNIIQVQVNSGTDIHLPIGSCVAYPEIKIFDNTACSIDKNRFLKNLYFLDNAPKNSVPMLGQSGVSVNCRSKNGSLITLDKNICLQIGGSIEVK